jgi:hypothetical protein
MRYSLIIVLLCYCLTVSGTTYYVSSAGNDAGSGLSVSTSWRTIAKVNSFSFAAGDQVLFAKGNTWLETLAPAVSGNSSNRITFDAYGSGALPIIGGKGSVTGWSTSGNWTNQGNNRWSIGITGVMMSDTDPRLRIWLSGIEPGRASSSSGVNSTYMWYTSGTVLWVYATSNPASYYSNVERGDAYGASFIISSRSYLTFKNIDFRGGGWSDVCLTNCSYIIFDGCNIGLYACNSGLDARGSSHCEVKNCTLDSGDRVMDTWESRSCEDGLHLQNGATGCTYWEIHNNTFKDWGHCCMLVWGDDASNKMAYINIYDNYYTNQDVDYGSAHTINGFTGGIDGTNGVHIFRNNLYSMGTNDQMTTDGDLLYYDNIINGTRGNIYKPSRSGYGVGCFAYGSEEGIGQKFYNNTIVNCLDGAIILINYASGAEVYDNEFVNNIFANNGSNNSNFQIVMQANSPTYGYYVLQNTFKNNLIYSSATNNTIYYGHSPTYPSGTTYTVGMFNAANGTASDIISGNVFGNPLFVSTSDFHLQPGSPAIGKGLAISGITTDYNSNTVKNPPSIGAYENGSVVAPQALPVYQSSVVENAAPSLLVMTYNLILANVVPSASAFLVSVNSVIKIVNRVDISGTNVQLTMASPIVNGDVVTVSFTEPASNQLQTASGAIAANVRNQPVINNCINVDPVAISSSVNNGIIQGNLPPVITISNPSKGNKYEKLATISIDAVASDPDGTISKVEFYSGETKLVELTSAPYTYIWKDVPAGTYIITAIATDNLNETTVSEPVEFQVGSKVKFDANSDIINLYPNPNDGHFSIEFINPLQNEKSQIIITDLAGKQVFNGPVTKEEILKQFDLSYAKSGIYVMMIKDKEILVTKKFIKN